MRPAFSEVLPEAEYSTVDDAVPPTIFLDDHTVDASAKHGFKLLTYRSLNTSHCYFYAFVECEHPRE